MLKKRIITALIMLFLVIGVIFFAPTLVFKILSGLLLLGACWEWGGLLAEKCSCLVTKLGLMLLVIATTIAAMCYLPTVYTLAFSGLMTLWALLAIMMQEKSKHPAGFHTTTPKVIAAIYLLTPTFVALVVLRASSGGASLLFFALTLIFINDTAAYFAGRQFGKNKLAPSVSPKKTWEGCVAGIAVGIIWSLVITNCLWGGRYALLPMLLTATITLITAVIGDLFISVLKRQINLKDTGSLLPGHGGLLDRLDAVIMALPVFALCASVFGQI